MDWWSKHCFALSFCGMTEKCFMGSVVTSEEAAVGLSRNNLFDVWTLDYIEYYCGYYFDLFIAESQVMFLIVQQ
jgi:hypothetical protein